MPTAEGLHTLVNDQSDRIFLVNDRGLVQCLREIGAVEPTLYRKEEPSEPPAAEAKPTIEEGERPTLQARKRRPAAEEPPAMQVSLRSPNRKRPSTTIR
jgi:hypothetical protein